MLSRRPKHEIQRDFATGNRRQHPTEALNGGSQRVAAFGLAFQHTAQVLQSEGHVARLVAVGKPSVRRRCVVRRVFLRELEKGEGCALVSGVTMRDRMPNPRARLTILLKPIGLGTTQGVAHIWKYAPPYSGEIITAAWVSPRAQECWRYHGVPGLHHSREQPVGSKACSPPPGCRVERQHHWIAPGR